MLSYSLYITGAKKTFSFYGGIIIKEDKVKISNNEIAKQVVLEEIILNAIKIPGVKVERKKFLAEQFATRYDNLEEILNVGPISAGVNRTDINVLSRKLILTRTSQSSIASFVAGIPGGLAMAATIPADVLQFFGMSLRLAQELSYLYGADDLWKDGNIDDEKVRNQLILYCGVMFGVSGAVSGVRVLSTQVSKTALKKIPQQALTKTFWYPIIKKTCKFVGVSVTKKTFSQGVSKIIPVVGGVISGGINFASMIPVANRLNDTLDKAIFDYSNEEFENDIEIIMNVSEEDVEETEEFGMKITSKIIDTTKKLSDMFSINKDKKNEISSNDPYEEIRKLKALLDDGILSEKEFEKKKKELLNL